MRAWTAIIGALLAAESTFAQGFTLYNITPFSPGHEEEAAARAVDLERRTGVNLALYCLSLHPTGRPALAKVDWAIASYRRFREALSGTAVRPCVLVQSILGHWPRVDGDIEPWMRTVDSTGVKVRFCPRDPGFAAYIVEVFTRLAREKPAFVMLDDDVRAFSHHAECFCERHVQLLNERCGTSYSADELRTLLKRAEQDDALYVAFLALQREMIEEEVVGRARAAMDAVDATIPGGVCVAAEEHFLCAPLARRFAAKGQRPVLRISNGCYNERGWGARIPWRICRAPAFAEYYRQSGIDLIAEADTCPHTLWSKSAQSFFSHLVCGAFAGLSGAKVWYVNGRKGQSRTPVSPKYAETLERHRGYLDSLATEVEGTEPYGVAVPCFTNFPNWHFMGEARQFFLEPSNAGSDVFVPFGIPFRVSKAFGTGVFAIRSAEEVARMTDGELDKFFSGRVLVFREAALALTRRGRGDLIGAEARMDRLAINVERDSLTGEMMGRSPVNGDEVRLTPCRGATTLSTLGFEENGRYESVVPSAVFGHNRLGGSVVTVSYSTDMLHLFVFSEARKRWLLALLDRLCGQPLSLVAGHDQDVLVWARRKGDGAFLALAENMNPEPIDQLAFRLSAGHWRAERLSDNGVWQAVPCRRKGEFVELPVSVPYFATAVVRFTRQEGSGVSN